MPWLRSLIGIVLWFWVPTGSALGHPQDGPHADVRIAITDREVRFNLGFNLPFIDEAAPTVREMMDVIDPAESSIVERALLDYIRTQHKVIIDGVEVSPRFEPVSIERLDDSLMGLFPNMGRAALTRLSLVVVYPFNAEPNEVRMKWGAFPGDVLSIGLEGRTGDLPPMLIQAQIKAEGRIQIVHFSESEPWVTWRPSGTAIADNMEPVPVPAQSKGQTIPILSLASAGVAFGLCVVMVSLGKRTIGAVALVALLLGSILLRHVGVIRIGESSLTDAQALALFEPLHINVYRAFDYTADDDVYDALARSVSGELLDDLYTQIRSGLVQAENDGAIGRVTDVQLDSARVEQLGVGASSDGFDVRANWQVEGTVYHFGHSHAKRRGFEAVFRVEPGDNGWRITRAEPVGVRDLRPAEL